MLENRHKHDTIKRRGKWNMTTSRVIIVLGCTDQLHGSAALPRYQHDRRAPEPKIAFPSEIKVI
jgi:hypothetical protein